MEDIAKQFSYIQKDLLVPHPLIPTFMGNNSHKCLQEDEGEDVYVKYYPMNVGGYDVIHKLLMFNS